MNGKRRTTKDDTGIPRVASKTDNPVHRTISPEENALIAHSLWHHLVIGVAIVDTDGTFIKVNPALCELLEYVETELTDKTFMEITHPADLNDDLEMIDKVKNGEIDGYAMTKRYISKTGRVIWVKLKIRRIPATGKLEYFLSQINPVDETTSQMISELKAQQTALELRSSYLQEKLNSQTEQRQQMIEFLEKHWKKIGIGILTVLGIIFPGAVKTFMEIVASLGGP